MAHEQVMDILKPDGGDYLAMGVGFLAYFIISFLWWGPLFGKKWGAMMGYDMDERPPMGIPILLQAVGTALLAYVLWHVMMAFTATHEGTELAMGSLAVGDAMIGAVYTWAGFFVPAQLGKVAWEKASWPLAALNAGGHLLGLLGMALAFALV